MSANAVGAFLLGVSVGILVEGYRRRWAASAWAYHTRQDDILRRMVRGW